MSNLRQYAGRCNEFVSELKTSLPAGETEKLRSDCAALGFEDWSVWLLENVETVKAFVSATPSERQRRGSWRDPKLKRFLVLAAIQYAAFGRDLLVGIDDYYLEAGCSYREMAARAGEAYWNIFYYKNTPAWPFDPPDPFDISA